MKKRRFVFSLLLVVLMILSLAPAALADFEFESENISGEYDETVFLAGSDPTSTADVRGILFVAGNTVSAGGKAEYVFLAGNTLIFNGDCSRDAFMAGNSLTISGSVARDLYAAGRTLSFRGQVGRSLYATGQSITLGGEIAGDVFLNAESIQLMDDLTVGGTLHYNSDAKIDGRQDMLLFAEAYENSSAESGEDNGEEPVDTSPSPLAKLRSKLNGFVGLLLIAYFLLWLTPLWEKLDERYTGTEFGKYAASFGIGFAVLIALPVAAILLMITGFGLRPAFVLLFVYAAALVAAPIFPGFILGSLLWRRAFRRSRNYWAELAIGILVLRLLALLPGVSFAVGLISMALGLGMLTRLLGKKRPEPPAPTEQLTVQP